VGRELAAVLAAERDARHDRDPRRRVPPAREARQALDRLGDSDLAVLVRAAHDFWAANGHLDPRPGDRPIPRGGGRADRDLAGWLAGFRRWAMTGTGTRQEGPDPGWARWALSVLGMDWGTDAEDSLLSDAEQELAGAVWREAAAANHQELAAARAAADGLAGRLDTDRELVQEILGFYRSQNSSKRSCRTGRASSCMTSCWAGEACRAGC